MYKLVIDGQLLGYGSYEDLEPEFRRWLKIYKNVKFERVNHERKKPLRQYLRAYELVAPVS